MIPCNDCGHWHHIDELTGIEFGPRTGAWICNDCWLMEIDL